MSQNINIQSKEIFNTFQDKLDFELSYQNYQKILLLINKYNLININDYIENYVNNNDNFILYIQMILSYYSDIYCKTNIQNYNFCLEVVKQNGYTLQYVSNKIKDKYYDINFEATKQNGFALQYVSDNIKDIYYQINLEAIKKDGRALQYISKQYKENYNINFEAVKQNRYSLETVIYI